MIAVYFTETYSTTMLQLSLLQIWNFELHIIVCYKPLPPLEASSTALSTLTILYLQISLELNSKQLGFCSPILFLYQTSGTSVSITNLTFNKSI